MTDRATAWSVTINNPTAEDDEEINSARQKGWKVDGQREVGNEGTPHYQLIVKTPQVRFSAVKKHFTRAHIEVCRNVAALEQYVHKEDTKEAELPSQSKFYPSLTRLWDMWYEFNHSLNIVHTDFLDAKELEANFERFIHYSIREGYYVESIASNPATISMVRKYGFSILHRSEYKFYENLRKGCVDKKTDRQIDSHES